MSLCGTSSSATVSKLPDKERPRIGAILRPAKGAWAGAEGTIGLMIMERKHLNSGSRLRTTKSRPCGIHLACREHCLPVCACVYSINPPHNCRCGRRQHRLNVPGGARCWRHTSHERPRVWDLCFRFATSFLMARARARRSAKHAAPASRPATATREGTEHLMPFHRHTCTPLRPPLSSVIAELAASRQS